MYKLFDVAGYSRSEVDEKFSGMINALSYGAPPHGGIAPGVDRIVMLLANKNNIPILFVHNTTGFMVGKRHEQNGMVNHGAQLIHAVAGSEVPHITLIVGNSYGAGNYAMCGRSFDPRFLFTYPNVKSGVMGAEQLAGVMEIIKLSKLNSLLFLDICIYIYISYEKN